MEYKPPCMAQVPSKRWIYALDVPRARAHTRKKGTFSFRARPWFYKPSRLSSCGSALAYRRGWVKKKFAAAPPSVLHFFHPHEKKTFSMCIIYVILLIVTNQLRRHETMHLLHQKTLIFPKIFFSLVTYQYVLFRTSSLPPSPNGLLFDHRVLQMIKIIPMMMKSYSL